MEHHLTLRSYVLGFASSVALTLAAYVLVEGHVLSHHQWLSHEVIITSIVALAVVQLLAQLYFFLHLGKKSTPAATTIIFAFALLIVGIVVGGSLWIMSNLNYNMMSHTDMNAYMESQDSL